MVWRGGSRGVTRQTILVLSISGGSSPRAQPKPRWLCFGFLPAGGSIKNSEVSRVWANMKPKIWARGCRHLRSRTWQVGLGGSTAVRRFMCVCLSAVWSSYRYAAVGYLLDGNPLQARRAIEETFGALNRPENLEYGFHSSKYIFVGVGGSVL